MLKMAQLIGTLEEWIQSGLVQCSIGSLDVPVQRVSYGRQLCEMMSRTAELGVREVVWRGRAKFANSGVTGCALLLN